MPVLVSLSDSEADSDDDTDPGDFESDTEVLPEADIPMPPLAELSDDSDSEDDLDDDATDTMSVESADPPALDDDADSDDDELNIHIPLEDDLANNVPATVRLNNLSPYAKLWLGVGSGKRSS